MRPFRATVALFLAIFWMIATQHCGLEAAGVLAAHCEQASGAQGCGGADHDGDACKTVESGEYKLADVSSKVSPPQLVACVCLTYIAFAELRPEPSAESLALGYFERAPNWVPTWQFVQRAALTPRAPTLA
jgi:hypothetical protein